jgi:predicted PurR-regulated permease PerM
MPDTILASGPAPAPAPGPALGPAPDVAPAPPGPPSPQQRGATRAQRVGLLLGLATTTLLALYLFSSILLPFVAAAGIAYFLDPPTTRLTRVGMPRGAAAFLMLVALIAACLLFALLLYPLLVAQLGLLISRAPTYAGSIYVWAGDMVTRLQDTFGPEYVDGKLRDLVGGQAGSMLSFLASALTRVIGGGFALFNVVSLVVVTPVVGFYLLRDWRRAVARVDIWMPRRYADVLRAQAREVDRILSAWVRGQALCCLVLAGFYAFTLSLVGLDLPYVGSIVGAVASIGLALAQFQWQGVAVVAGVFVTGQLLEGYVIYPRFLGDRVELHAVWVIFALFAGGAAFGFLGVLMAVPIAAAIGVLARFWLRRYLVSALYTDPPSQH